MFPNKFAQKIGSCCGQMNSILDRFGVKMISKDGSYSEDNSEEHQESSCERQKPFQQIDSLAF
jgi:hypothetical protein